MIEIIPNWHPVFVHFTVALLVVASITHLLAFFLPKGELVNQLAIVAHWNLWFGMLFTLLTVAAGWYAYNTVGHDAPSHIAMTEHRNWAMATFAVFLGVSGWEYYLSRRGNGKGRLFIAMLIIATVLLLSTAWHGGELVYRYGLGVMSTPTLEGPDHAHDPGEGHGDMNEHAVDTLHEGEHAHGQDDTENGHHLPEENAGRTSADANSEHPLPKNAGHVHAPGTEAHKD